MLIDKNIKEAKLENIEIKRIMSEGGVLWEKEYAPIPGLLESDVFYDNFYIKRDNVSINKKYGPSEGNKIIVNGNYEEMYKISGSSPDTGYVFHSTMNITVYFIQGGYSALNYNNNGSELGVAISENKNNGNATIKKLSETKYEINLLKDIKSVYVEVHFYGNHEVSKNHFLDLCKQCDIKVEID